jgi:uncharacterized membrane protein
MTKNIYLKGFVRATIPLSIMLLLSAALEFGEHDHANARGALFAGLVFGFVAGFSVIYEVEKWSLLKQSIVHFACMVVTVLPCLFFSGWFRTETMADYLKIIGVFLLCGVVLWTICYVVFGKIINKGGKNEV